MISRMAQFPISTEDAEREIKTLVTEKGLDVITSKMIRKHLEAKFNTDFEECKANLDTLIESCIYAMEANGEIKLISSAESQSANDLKTALAPAEASDSGDEDLNGKAGDNNQKSQSSTKARKRKAPVSEKEKSPSLTPEADDMATAIKRRRNPNIAKSKKREPKAKSKEKSNKGNQGKMFSKICALSPELSNLLGKRYLRRSDVVKEMWNYFKSNNLQDPKNKQFYFLDDPLKKIFGKKAKIKPFGMMAVLKNHVKDIEFLDDATRQIAEAEIAQILENEENSNSTSNPASNLNESTCNEQPEQEESGTTEVDSAQPNSEVEAEDTNSKLSYSNEDSKQSFAPASADDSMLDIRPSTSAMTYQKEEEQEDNGHNNKRESSADDSSDSADSSAESSSSEESNDS